MVIEITREHFNDPEIRELIRHGFETCNSLHGNQYDWSGFPILKFIETQRLTVCFRNKKPIGYLMATIGPSFFDPRVIVAKQNMLFSLPNTRATYELMKDFIDFGKTNANHIITMIGEKTNIKPKSLKKLGFKELETLYRMEF